MTGTRWSIPGIGEAWLDPVSLQTASLGIPSTDLVFTMQSVASPSLNGALVHWRGAVLSGNATVTLTNPSGYLRR